MFDNIGEKLKRLATVECVVGIVCSVISGLVMCFNDMILVGLLTAGLGSIAAWIASWVTYAIGEIAVNTSVLVVKTSNHNRSPARMPTATPTRIKTKTTSAKGPTKKCPHCGELVRSSLCEMCGLENQLFNQPSLSTPSKPKQVPEKSTQQKSAYTNDLFSRIQNANSQKSADEGTKPRIKKCPHCGESVTSNRCTMCGLENNLFN